MHCPLTVLFYSQTYWASLFSVIHFIHFSSYYTLVSTPWYDLIFSLNQQLTVVKAKGCFSLISFLNSRTVFFCSLFSFVFFFLVLFLCSVFDSLFFHWLLVTKHFLSWILPVWFWVFFSQHIPSCRLIKSHSSNYCLYADNAQVTHASQKSLLSS